MRATAATQALKDAVRQHFDADVADAITDDTDMFTAVARRVGSDATNATDIDRRIAAISRATEGYTLDWLADEANSPAGWLYSQL